MSSSHGSNSHSQLGLPPPPPSIPPNHALPAPTDLSLPPPPSSPDPLIACGSRHTIATDGTTVYGCGWSKWGQLGHPNVSAGDELDWTRVDVPVLGKGQRVVGVFAGGWRTVVVPKLDLLKLDVFDKNTDPAEKLSAPGGSALPLASPGETDIRILPQFMFPARNKWKGGGG
ncbi:hypothetical protein BDK51DRAFT_46985 [Blyttiomyces helicus]|uniref:Regulator of chromosome condensation 1/beta-lactamase-inhibitor protein II n=1 Tax=Blyttiomyces helicus TaxID=388810 RepID=A0A4P9W673_9FUNG|nr:hypothetical protein BDK51DRAFT_46985 [Blyttiomyces helicus]|eukprot:RKO86418.1 hypothetical protein BDK51DRAFT_46985 [Blyttiomyces helicus]